MNKTKLAIITIAKTYKSFEQQGYDTDVLYDFLSEVNGEICDLYELDSMETWDLFMGKSQNN